MLTGVIVLSYHSMVNQVTIEKTQKYLIVKIPLTSVENGKAELSLRAQKIIDKAVAQGLTDIDSGRVFGPFKSVQEFRKSLRSVR